MFADLTMTALRTGGIKTAASTSVGIVTRCSFRMKSSALLEQTMKQQKQAERLTMISETLTAYWPDHGYGEDLKASRQATLNHPFSKSICSRFDASTSFGLEASPSLRGSNPNYKYIVITAEAHGVSLKCKQMGNQSSQLQKPETGADEDRVTTSHRDLPIYQSPNRDSSPSSRRKTLDGGFAFSGQLPRSSIGGNQNSTPQVPFTSLSNNFAEVPSPRQSANCHTFNLTSSNIPTLDPEISSTPGHHIKIEAKSSSSRPPTSQSATSNSETEKHWRRAPTHPDNMSAFAENLGDMRPYLPQSSMDLDASMSFTNGNDITDGSQYPSDLIMSSEPGQFASEDAVDGEKLNEKARRKALKKERKAARKAKQLQMELLAENSDADNNNHSDHEVKENIAGPATSSKKRKRKHKSQPNIDLANIDPALLPTTNDAIVSNDLALPANGSIDIDQPTKLAVKSSPLKRKADSSEKKQRKRNKHNKTQDQFMEDGTIDASDKSSKKRSKSKAPSQIGELAPNLFAQHYSAPSSSALEQNAALQEALGSHATEESPSVARLERRSHDNSAVSDIAGVDAQIFQEYPVTAGKLVAEAGMDFDEDFDGNDEDHLDSDPFRSASEGDAGEGAEDEEMVDVNFGHEVTDNDGEEQFGSDDMGVAVPPETDDQAIENDINSQDNDIERVIVGVAKSSPKRTRQYGSKSNSGRKRFAKPSYFDREEKEQIENSTDALTPAAATASRRYRKKQEAADEDKEELVAGPSNAKEKGKGKPAKISSMIRSGGGSGSGSPATSSTVRKSRKVKDPAGEDEQTGPFSDFELRNINVAMDRWRADNNLTQYEVNEIVHKNPQRSNTGEFWDFIHTACPNRKRQKLINVCRRKFHNFVARGTWTEEQHNELKEAYNMHGPKYKVIATQINRHPEDVRDRIRNYVICGDNLKKEAWDQSEEARLLGIIDESLANIRTLKNTERPDLHGRPDEELIDWQIVSENMGRSRSRLQCMTKWKKIKAAMEGGSIDGETGLSVDERIQRARDSVAAMDSRDLYEIVKAVKKTGVNADSRIPWAKLRGFKNTENWSRATLMLAWYRLRISIPGWKQMSVPETATQLMSTFQETGEINLLSDEQVDLSVEHREMKHKLQRILKETNRNRHKTPRSSFVVHSDDDDDDDEEEKVALDAANSEASEVEDEDRDPDRSSVDLGLDESRVSEEREIDESVLGSPPASKSRRKGKQADTAAIDGPEPRSKRIRRKLRNEEEEEEEQQEADLETSSQIDDPVPAIFKNTLSRSKGAIMAEPSSSRKAAEGKGKQVVLADYDRSEHQSSDTDPEDAEDIPARV